MRAMILLLAGWSCGALAGFVLGAGSAAGLADDPDVPLEPSPLLRLVDAIATAGAENGDPCPSVPDLTELICYAAARARVAIVDA